MGQTPQPPSLLIRPSEVEQVDRGAGIVTLPMVGKWNSTQSSVTTGVTSFAPGTGIPLHSHNVDECVLVLEGEATVTIGEDEFDVDAGVNTWVPAGVPHRFVNRGNSLMRIFWIYGGLQVTRTITATGQTFEHLSVHDRQ
ncbi:cupin domain-containing protein [Kibdelosporangium aridum]|uniref:Cupin domain-containing protein n=1 Tax=Kibdelosporangium aridum TaxID=2030 RepID=A0A428ZUC7_KIBAR|nr:cupin domain-containing protein [Kibdelosporangium aridum]RSM91631.1 cupin domain-containing protein [Kibdelosporangium aridum]